MITFTPAHTDQELQQILALQQQNLAKNISLETALEQGFLTVEHDFAILKKMNDFEKAIIAKEDEQVVGYLLAMTKDLRDDIPILVPMFEVFDHLEYQGQQLQHYHYIVVGQACIAASHRGNGTFDQCYNAYKHFLKDKYDFTITEISQRNQRSLRAHKRVGFEVIHSFVAPDGEAWDIVLWDWRGD
ncbi:MAG: GNAT family N-acetyltransferase [Saprospiraceae bacterium]